MKKRIKYPSKKQIQTADPVQVDEVRLHKVILDFELQTATIHANLIDSDGGGPDKDGNPIAVITGKRPIEMGLETIGQWIKINQIEKETLDAIVGSGRLPAGDVE